MPRKIRFYRLDGAGMDTVDLEDCQRFPIRNGPQIASSPHATSMRSNSYLAQVFYLTPDQRWILCHEEEHRSGGGVSGYMERHPVVAARAMHLNGMPLPPELKAYRYSATLGYIAWLGKQSDSRVRTSEVACVRKQDELPAKLAQLARFPHLVAHAKRTEKIDKRGRPRIYDEAQDRAIYDAWMKSPHSKLRDFAKEWNPGLDLDLATDYVRHVIYRQRRRRAIQETKTRKPSRKS